MKRGTVRPWRWHLGLPAATAEIDRWTRRLWYISQHDKMVIDLAGQLQEVVNEMRAATGLDEFGWNTVLSASAVRPRPSASGRT